MTELGAGVLSILAQAARGAKNLKVHVFTEDGSYEASEGTARIELFLSGGGGGGASTNGGDAGSSYMMFAALEAGVKVAIEVGAGGEPGQAGGNTKFGDKAIAYGGGGGRGEVGEHSGAGLRGACIIVEHTDALRAD